MLQKVFPPKNKKPTTALSAPQPSTSPALRELWVGECTGSFPPTPTPRMLGQSATRSLHRRRPASSAQARRLPSARPGRRSAARPVRDAELPQAADGASVECPPDTGGTGDPPRSGRSDRPPHHQSTRRATVQRDARFTRPRHQFLLFHRKIWNCRSLCVYSRCDGMTRCGFPRGFPV